ncbi:MAG: cupredoxin domain-containing protein [Thermoplasmatota archaeon]
MASTMLRPLLIVAAAALALVSPSQAASTLHLAIEARDVGCEGGAAYCFVVTEGRLSDLSAGAHGSITFTNRGQVNHEIHLMAATDADPTHTGTDESLAFATSPDDMPPGASVTFNFTVPRNAAAVYIFCAAPGHEAAGMWMQIEGAQVRTSPAGAGWATALALAGLAGVKRTRA